MSPTLAVPEEAMSPMLAIPEGTISRELGEPWYEQGAGDACGDVGSCSAAACESCAVPCAPCVPEGWVQGEYLMWWPRPMQIPTLVTSGTPASRGVLGAAGTETLLGDEMLDRLYSGARLRFGLWADPCHEYAWAAEGFIAGRVTERQTFSGTGAAGSGALALPFFNVLTTAEAPNGREDAELVAYPERIRGTVTVAATSQLHGASVHAMRTLSRSCDCAPAALSCGCLPAQRHWSGFVGWRYLNLDERLQLNEDLTSLLPAPDSGRFLIEDRFETTNTFNGLDLGVLWKGCRGPYSLDLLMRLALGSCHQDVSIAGSTTLTDTGVTSSSFQNATGGVFAQRTNIGDYSRNRFAVVPELGITLGCAITPQWRATVGYTFLYWSSVVRPGEQIDRDINPNLFPPEEDPLTGLERPIFTFVESDLWVNGLNIGLERVW